MNRYKMHEPKKPYNFAFQHVFKQGDRVSIKTEAIAQRQRVVTDRNGYIDAIFSLIDIRVVTDSDFNAYHWRPEELELRP